MATVQELINRTLRLITYLPAGESATHNDSDDTLDALNDLLAQWMDDGIPIDPGTLDVMDTFSVDGGDLRAVRYNLAVDIWPEFFPNQPINPVLSSRAMELRRSIFAKYSTIETADFDRALKQRYNTSYNIVNDS